jgi:hypothetical protein
MYDKATSLTSAGGMRGPGCQPSRAIRISSRPVTPYVRGEVMLCPEPGFARPFEYQYRTDKARNMDGCGAYLCSFVLALERGYQFPSLLSLLKEDVFQVCRPVLVVRIHVENLVVHSM